MSEEAEVVVDAASVRDMVIGLIEEAKMSPTEISDALDGRVSSRTVYRWARGESIPQNHQALQALQTLHSERCAA